MATYNGSAYIEQQLSSILSQLKPNDEIVLVDDHSSDATLSMVRAMDDPRIKIHPNSSNLGVLKTFERAIQLAIGDVIFLSDQDDIWYPEKVVKMISIFATRPEVTLVLSDAKIIDANGVVLNASFFQGRGRFSPGVFSTIVKNKYLGCTMAFRRILVSKALPFPSDIPMHDMWIGCIGKIYGAVSFIDFPLMGYRRHSNNVSPVKRQTVFKMLVWRWRLVKNLGQRVLLRGFKF